MIRRLVAVLALAVAMVSLYIAPAAAARPDPRIDSVGTSFTSTTGVVGAQASLLEVRGKSHLTIDVYEGSSLLASQRFVVRRATTSVATTFQLQSGDAVTRVDFVLTPGHPMQTWTSYDQVQVTGLAYTYSG